MKNINLWTENDWRIDYFGRILAKVYDDQMKIHVYMLPEQLDEIAKREGKYDTPVYQNFRNKINEIYENYKTNNDKGFTKEMERLDGPRIEVGRTNYHNGIYSDYYIYILVTKDDYERKNDSWKVDSRVKRDIEKYNVMDLLLYDEYNQCFFYIPAKKIKIGTEQEGKIYIPFRHFEVFQLSDKFPSYLTKK